MADLIELTTSEQKLVGMYRAMNDIDKQRMLLTFANPKTVGNYFAENSNCNIFINSYNCLNTESPEHDND